MAVPPDVWPLLGLFWLLAALPVHSRGDAFQAEEIPENGLDETTSLSEDILDINQELLLREVPETCFLIEGDIVKVSPFWMLPSANPRWPKKGGIVQVPYVISYKYDKSSAKRIQEAFRDFEESTCVKFVPYTSQRDYVCIAPLSGCFSSVGRTGGKQVVSLAAACLEKGKRVILHELMHVLGFWHEHSRADRDEYISISWDEILTGFETNFRKSWSTNMLVDYDYSSVMHYGRNAFSVRGFPTIVPLSRSCHGIGQSWNLSSSDVARVNKLYQCSRVAALPEAATENATRGTVADFLPSELEPSLPPSQADLPTAWSLGPVASSTGMVPSARETLQPVGTAPLASRVPGFHATEGHDWRMVSGETSSKAEVAGKLPVVMEGMLRRTQPTEMTAESISREASMAQGLQNVASSPNQPQVYKEEATSSQQNATETMRQAAPDMAFTTSPLLASPAPLTAEGPSTSILHQHLSWIGSVHGEQTEPPASKAVGTNASGEDNGSPSPASSVMENTTKEQEEVFQTMVSQAGEQVHTPSMSVQAKATSATSSITLSPEGPGIPIMATNIGRLFSPMRSGAGSLAVFTIDHDSGLERLHEKSKGVLTSTLSSSGRASLSSETVLRATSEKAPALASSGHDLDQSRPIDGAQSPWATITSYLAASRLKGETGRRPTDRFKEVEQSSLPPAHPTREGELFTLLPRGSVLPTEQTQSEKWTLVHVELVREPASLVTETKRIALPTEGSSWTRVSWSPSPESTELRRRASWEQLIGTKGYGSSTLVPRQTPPAGGVHRGEGSQPALEAGPLVTVVKPSLGQRTSLGLGHEEEPGGQVHGGTELPGETKADGSMSPRSMLSTVSPGTQVSVKPKQVVTEEPRPGAEAPGPGSILPITETVSSPSEMSPSWTSRSRDLGEGNGRDRQAESLEDASLAARSEPAKLLKGTATASSERTATMIQESSAKVSTALAPGGPQEVGESPSSHPVGGTEFPTPARSPLVLFGDQTTGGNDYSKPGNARLFAEGRLAEPATVSDKMTQEGANSATTTHGLNATLEPRGRASHLLEVGSSALTSQAVTQGTAQPRTAGSLESPKLVFHSKGLAASHPPGGQIAAPTGSPVGTVTASHAHTATVPPLEAWGSQATARAVNTVSKPSQEPSMETPAVGTPPPPGFQRPASPGASLFGRTTVKPAGVGSPQLQTGVVRLEGTAWSTSDTWGKTKVMKFLFEKGERPTMESGVPLSPYTAPVYTQLGPERSAVNSTRIPEAASASVGPFLSKNWGESTATSGSVSPTSKWTLKTIGSLSPAHGRASETASSVLGAETPSGGETVLLSGVSLENRYPIPGEAIKATTASSRGISPVPLQTLGLAEIGTPVAYDRSHVTQGPRGYSKRLLGKWTPVRTGSTERLSPSEELSKPTSKVQTAVRTVEKPTSLAEEPQEYGRPSMDSRSIHRIGKRSQPELVPIPPPVFVSVSPKETHCDCEPMKWHIQHLRSREPEVAESEATTRTFLRKRGLEDTWQFPGGSSSGCTNHRHFGHSAVGHPDGGTSEGTEPSRGSNVELAHLRGWFFQRTMAGNAQLVLRNILKPAQPLVFCCFEEDLCGWAQSKEEGLEKDSVLEKEQEQLMDAGIPSNGGRISLKPSDSEVLSPKAILVSPVLQGSGCLKLFYSPMGPVVGNVRIYTAPLNSSEWRLAWSTKWDRDLSWYPLAIPLSRTCKLQVVLDGVEDHTSLAGMDTLICRKPCWQCSNVLCKPNKRFP